MVRTGRADGSEYRMSLGCSLAGATLALAMKHRTDVTLAEQRSAAHPQFQQLTEIKDFFNLLSLTCSIRSSRIRTLNAPTRTMSTKKRKTRSSKTPPEQPSKQLPTYVTTGDIARSISVGLSYKLVELFSEGLYSSANKTFEELVTNSFDAGATSVHVVLPATPSSEDANIVVVDNGTSMDLDGLEALWKIGVSSKRDQPSPSIKNLGRQPIGKFGIGKLATYVLASRLTYLCKSGKSYHSVSMDYKLLDQKANQGLATNQGLDLDVRSLSTKQARDALAWLLRKSNLNKWDLPLFGKDAWPSWTIAILSSLKDKAHQIEPGRLQWILSTALPIRDDFEIYLDGKKLQPSKIKKRIQRYTLGKEVNSDLPKPAPADELTSRTDTNFDKKNPKYYGLYHPVVGRLTGYCETYRDALTSGKSTNVGRSYGFFIYIRDRLINVDDEYFGIDSNLLRHGTFARFRLVVNADKLDSLLQSAREGIRESPELATFRNILRGIFNFVRPKLEEALDKEKPGSRISRRLASSPASLARRPLTRLIEASTSGSITPRYLEVPLLSGSAREDFLSQCKDRINSDDHFVKAVDFTTGLSPTDPVAKYDARMGVLKLNALHPFVGAFADEFTSKQRRQPLELFAMAEILLEAQLHQGPFKKSVIDDLLSTRDELFRHLGKSTGRRTAAKLAQDLRDARNNKDALEEEIVAAFQSLGFDASRIGGQGNPDGIASAHLSADNLGKKRAYRVTLEAKSTETDTKTVSAKTVGVSRIARHRTLLDADHAVVVAARFPTKKKKEKSALLEEMEEDRKNTGKTITLITIDDLARLVREAPLSHLSPSALRDLFSSCYTPEQSASWINSIKNGNFKNEPYKQILEAIWAEQQEDPTEVVQFSALRVALRKGHKIQKSNEELKLFCTTLSALIPNFVMVRDSSVELEVPPERAWGAIDDVLANQRPVEA